MCMKLGIKCLLVITNNGFPSQANTARVSPARPIQYKGCKNYYYNTVRGQSSWLAVIILPLARDCQPFQAGLHLSTITVTCCSACRLPFTLLLSKPVL